MTLQSSSSDLERLLTQSGRSLVPDAGAKGRVFSRMQRKMSTENLLHTVRRELTPEPSSALQTWQTVRRGLRPVTTRSFWDAIKDRILPTPEAASLVWSRILPRMALEPVAVPRFRPAKWAAAFAVLAIVVRLSPMLVLAPSTVAESPVTATRTRGLASVLVGGLWQPIETELRLRAATRLSTEEGEMTIVLHDDAVVRLAPHTSITLNDLSDRPESSSGEPTVSLHQGTIWLMGFAPKPLRGITVGTAQGWITLQEGSLSVRQGTDNVVAIRSWDRSATVTRRGIAIGLLAGEELTLERSASLTPVKMASGPYDDPWVALNLSRDAVHQKEIAQMQRERRAAQAGILPDSRLYPVKRLAETVDVLLTFGSEARTRKVLTHANTRLNEAAALLATGSGTSAEAQVALDEFRQTVLAVASGSGDTVVSALLEDEFVTAATADTSAALPSDEAYALKQTVRETIASLPDSIEKPDTTAAAVLDEVALAKRRAQEGDIVLAEAKLAQVKESLSAVSGSSALLSDSLRQEVEATIAVVENTVEDQRLEDDFRPITLPDTADALTRRVEPIRPSQAPVEPLTDEQVEAYVQRIRGQIFVFELKRSQLNELREQIRSLDRHPDRGRILRRLYKVMPANGLSQEVRRHIAALDEQNRELQQELMEGSGAVIPESETGTGTCVDCQE